jgi:hypothetical protein
MVSRDRFAALCLPLSFAGLMFLGGCAGGGRGSASVLPSTRLSTAAQQPPTRGTASLSAAQTEVPSQADGFVDSIGVNIHLSYYGTPYGDNFSLILQRLKALGVRHVRDGIAVGQNNLCSEYAQLAAAGIHDESLTTVNNGSNDLASWANCVGSDLEAFEAPNEYDISHGSDTNWAATLRAYQSTLYQWVKANIPAITVVGPSLTSESAYAAVGDLSNVEDYGNVHDYFSGRNPGTSGWGGTDAFGTYGAESYDIAIAKQATMTKPIRSTETGYSDGGGDPNWVSPKVKMHYTLRTFLEHWNAGITRTYLYQLLDQGGSPYSSYGLLDSAGNIKPAFTALSNLIGDLADPGPQFTPSSLAYSLTDTAQCLGPSPTLSYPLSESSGTTAADLSTSNSPGTYHGGVTYGVAGPCGTSAVTLDGTSGYVQQNSTISSPSGPFSQQVWFKTTTTTPSAIAALVTSTGAPDATLYVTSSGKITWAVYCPGTSGPSTATSPSSYNDGKWHQAIGTYTFSAGTGTISLIIDGSVVASTTVTAPINPLAGLAWRIGSSGGSGFPGAPITTNYFAGSVSNFSVYASALTTAQAGATQGSSVHHTLFQRRNGSFCLALWFETAEWDPNAETAIPGTPQSLVLGNFSTLPKTIAIKTFADATGTITTTPVTTAKDGTLTVGLTGGGVTLLDLSM